MSTDQEDGEMSYEHLDLSRKLCHACEVRLSKKLSAGKEWCTNPFCQVRAIKFNIPYKYRRYEI